MKKENKIWKGHWFMDRDERDEILGMVIIGVGAMFFILCIACFIRLLIQSWY